MMWFRMGALLHDVGKVSIPLEILTKPGRLDDSEWTVMAQHPVSGVELLEGVEFPWDVRPMIRHHHERWNGSGYPDRIAGETIPLEARILTIADVYDALTTTRSYRAAFPHEKAMEILSSEVGQTVDPGLFELFARDVAPRLEAGTEVGVSVEAPVPVEAPVSVVEAIPVRRPRAPRPRRSVRASRSPALQRTA
jgi:putative nucleotidyltransferase with HDIG domain